MEITLPVSTRGDAVGSGEATPVPIPFSHSSSFFFFSKFLFVPVDVMTTPALSSASFQSLA